MSIGPVEFNHVFFYQDILSRRATTITHEEEKGSTFSKASFSTADSATEISIDDPDFWKKWAKKVGKGKGVTEGVVAIHPKLELSLRVKLRDQGPRMFFTPKCKMKKYSSNNKSCNRFYFFYVFFKHVLDSDDYILGRD